MTNKNVQKKKKATAFEWSDIFNYRILAIFLILIAFILPTLIWGRKIVSFADLLIARAFNEKQDDRALSFYRNAILVDHKNEMAYLELADEYAKRNGYKEMAVSVLKAGIKENDSEIIKNALTALQNELEKENAGIDYEDPVAFFMNGDLQSAPDAIHAKQLVITYDGGDFVTDYQYDEKWNLLSSKLHNPEGRLLESIEAKPGENPYVYTNNQYTSLYDIDYQYDENGHLTSEICTSIVKNEDILNEYGCDYYLAHDDEDSFEIDDDMTFHMYSLRSYEVNYTYNNAGLITGITAEYGLRHYSVDVTAQYDGQGRITKMTTKCDGTGMDEERSYQYDGKGNCVKKVVSRKDIDRRDSHNFQYSKDNILIRDDCTVDFNLGRYWETAAKYYVLYFYDENGNNTGNMANENGRFIYTNRMEYDENNRLISHSYYVTEMNCWGETYEYDEKGNCIGIIKEYPAIYLTVADTKNYDNNGNLCDGLHQMRLNETSGRIDNKSSFGSTYTEHKYNADGQLEKVIAYTVKSNYPEEEESVRLDNGTAKWIVMNDAMGVAIGKLYEEYNKDGKITNQSYYDLDLKLVSKRYSTYDKYGRTESLTVYGETGEVKEHYLYTYDDNNRLICITETVNGRKEEFVYDEEGVLLKEVDEGNDLEYRYSYDSEGRLKELTRFCNGKADSVLKWYY